jgi:hypothetical protein
MLSSDVSIYPITSSLYKTISQTNLPLSDTHAESVDVLVNLIEQSDTLSNHVVNTVDVELDLSLVFALGFVALLLNFAFGLTLCLSLNIFLSLRQVLNIPASGSILL